jgi:hypothetical protein
MPSDVRVKLINDLADIEYGLFILLKLNFNSVIIIYFCFADDYAQIDI